MGELSSCFSEPDFDCDEIAHRMDRLAPNLTDLGSRETQMSPWRILITLLTGLVFALSSLQAGAATRILCVGTNGHMQIEQLTPLHVSETRRHAAVHHGVTAASYDAASEWSPTNSVQFEDTAGLDQIVASLGISSSIRGYIAKNPEPKQAQLWAASEGSAHRLVGVRRQNVEFVHQHLKSAPLTTFDRLLL